MSARPWSCLLAFLMRLTRPAGSVWISGASGNCRPTGFHGNLAVPQFRVQQLQVFNTTSLSESAAIAVARGGALQELRDDIVEPVDLALGHAEVSAPLVRIVWWPRA